MLENQMVTSMTSGAVEFFFPAGTTAAMVTADQALAMPLLTPTLTSTADNTVSIFLVGDEVYNWLKEENEKVLLFGSLYQAFDYLDEMESAQKYKQKFMEEIEQLNREEMMRKSSGGNTQMHYNGFGLI